MSERSEIRVNLVFRGRQLAEFLAIKEHLGVQTNADVVRYLVRRQTRALQRRERVSTQRRVRRRYQPAQRQESEAVGRAETQEEEMQSRGGRRPPAREEEVHVRPSELAHLCLDCPLPECDEGDPRCPYQRATGERERQRARTRAYMRRVRAK